MEILIQDTIMQLRKLRMEFFVSTIQKYLKANFVVILQYIFHFKKKMKIKSSQI